MLKSITIRNVASFNSIGVVLDNLKPINIVYGANGSGKTTISNLLKSPKQNEFSSCDFSWMNDFPLDILVYNKTFRDENFGKSTIDGVFTLGKATKDEIATIERMKSDLANLEQQGIQKKNVLDKLQNELSEAEINLTTQIWQCAYKNNERVFKEAFRGYMGKKETFRDKFMKVFASSLIKTRNREELEKLASEILVNMPSEIAKLSLPFNACQLQTIITDQIWTKKIIGKEDVEIAKMIHSLNMSDWVNQGRKFVHPDTTICPFCQKETLTVEFKEQLEKYFDNDFSESITHLGKMSDAFFRECDFIKKALSSLETNEKNNPNTKLDLADFHLALVQLDEIFLENKTKIDKKNREPSCVVNLLPIHEAMSVIENLIISANNKIEKWNNIVKNHVQEREKLVREIWALIVNENRDSIDTSLKDINGRKHGIHNVEDEITNLRTSYKDLNTKIIEANKNITSVQPAIDEINNTLLFYGFDNFMIVPAGENSNQYQIKRKDGSLAGHTLSEGEITFLTFLYFLQLTKGGLSQETVSNERVIIVDDPISSLDSSVLFVVSSLLKNLMTDIREKKGNIKQLVLLTHNIYFHKEVSFFNGRVKERSDTHFWILRKTNNVSSIEAYKTQNPIKNSYELLWCELQNSIINTSCITIQNIMRRIIEEYFKTLGGYSDDSILAKFENSEEKEICRSLICWINDGSHCIPDSLFVECPNDVIERYHKVFKSIFIMLGHEAHYNMMMHISN